MENYEPEEEQISPEAEAALDNYLQKRGFRSQDEVDDRVAISEEIGATMHYLQRMGFDEKTAGEYTRKYLKDKYE